jgi:diacylglycerol O-acyltransferase
VPARWQLLRDALVALGWNVRNLPSLLARTLGGLRNARRFRKESEVAPPMPFGGPNLPFHGALTPHRQFTMATLRLDDVKAVKAACGVSVNDVVLAMVAGSLRGWLEARHALPERALVAGVPVSTDAPEDTPRLGGNRVSNMFTSLRTDVADPLERLHAIHDVTSAAKEMHNVLGADMLADWSEYTPARPYSFLMRQYGRFRLADRHRPPINVVVSNVPGPREPLYVAGARLEGIYSVGPILEGIGLNITVWTYCEHVHVGVLACRDHVPDPREIADGMAAALAELVARAGVEPDMHVRT